MKIQGLPTLTQRILGTLFWPLIETIANMTSPYPTLPLFYWLFMALGALIPWALSFWLIVTVIMYFVGGTQFWASISNRGNTDFSDFVAMLLGGMISGALLYQVMAVIF